MDGAALQNLISKGWGTGARRVGRPYTVYRPSGNTNPLESRNRVVKLYASFAPFSGAALGITGYAGFACRGLFDSAYTATGDYLIGDATFFIISQWPLQPVLCVQANATITVHRPIATLSGCYSGYVDSTARQLISDWPALLTPIAARIPGTLPEQHYGTWAGLLPNLPCRLEVADILTDALGSRFVIASAQSTALGWRLGMRQVEG